MLDCLATCPCLASLVYHLTASTLLCPTPRPKEYHATLLGASERLGFLIAYLITLASRSEFRMNICYWILDKNPYGRLMEEK
ncbi:MAG: hypothetical protein J3R72DRAFT_448148 [Linnemannia gamsii]|nr:MAG: hypothetical protein J3R72DRAFT_448148 [Linnemannia gamsii]